MLKKVNISLNMELPSDFKDGKVTWHHKDLQIKEWKGHNIDAIRKNHWLVGIKHTRRS